jgi:hypothetical protein
MPYPDWPHLVCHGGSGVFRRGLKNLFDKCDPTIFNNNFSFMNKFFYHLDFWQKYLVSNITYDASALKQLPKIIETEREKIESWNLVRNNFSLEAANTINDFSLFKRTGYIYDLYSALSIFPNTFQFLAKFGDVFEGSSAPLQPTFIKARPINGDNENYVLMPLDTNRHFRFLKDIFSYESKKNMIVWRGNATQSHRKAFLRNTSKLSISDIKSNIPFEDQIEAGNFLSPAQQCEYKFILSLEGNDVATNLKWIMSSNSLCFMPKPKYETWYLESKLIPGEHYAEVSADGTNIGDVFEYYVTRPKLSKEIIRNAQLYAEPFQNRIWNFRCASAVAYSYFHLSGQL